LLTHYVFKLRLYKTDMVVLDPYYSIFDNHIKMTSYYNAKKVCLFVCPSCVIPLWCLLCCTVADPDHGV